MHTPSPSAFRAAALLLACAACAGPHARALQPGLRELALAPIMPPVAYGYSVGAPHVPPLPAELFGVKTALDAGQTAFKKRDYAAAAENFREAGTSSALGRFDVGLTELYVGENKTGLDDMRAGLALAQRQNLAIVAAEMQSALAKLSDAGFR